VREEIPNGEATPKATRSAAVVEYPRVLKGSGGVTLVEGTAAMREKARKDPSDQRTSKPNDAFAALPETDQKQR
jgi:hypothetical protein